MKNLSWKSIFGGYLVRCLGGIALGLVFIVPYLIQILKGAHFNPAHFQSVKILTIIALWGQLMNFVGGYLTALWAPDRKMVHVTILGFGTVLVGQIWHLAEHGTAPNWFHFIWVLTIPCVLLGGWLRVKTQGCISAPQLKPVSVSGSPPIASPFED